MLLLLCSSEHENFSYLAFISPTPAPSLGVCLSLVHGTQLHYSEFLYQLHSLCSVCTSIFMEAYPVPSLFSLFPTTILCFFPWTSLFFFLFCLFLFLFSPLFDLFLIVLPPPLCLSGELEKSYMNLFSSCCLSAPVTVSLCPFPCIPRVSQLW